MGWSFSNLKIVASSILEDECGCKSTAHNTENPPFDNNALPSPIFVAAKSLPRPTLISAS